MKPSISTAPEQLNQMIADTEAANRLFQPGSYWRRYVSRIQTAIEEDGLDAFRSNPRFDGFVDAQLFVDYLKSYGLTKKAFAAGQRVFRSFPRIAHQFSMFEHIEARILSLNVGQLALAHRYISGLPGAAEVLNVEDSGLGAPLTYMAPTGRRYSMDYLNKALKYLLVRRLLDFAAIETVVEIGGGFGMQAEVMLKAQPHLTYVIVDIPPQLFVSQSYLSAVFGNTVLTYAETRGWPWISADRVRASGKRVVMLAPHDLSRIDLRCDLLFSDFALMEIDFAALENYARLLRPHLAGGIFFADRTEMPRGSRDRDFSLDDVIGLFPEHKESHRSPYEHIRQMAETDDRIVDVLLSRVAQSGAR